MLYLYALRFNLNHGVKSFNQIKAFKSHTRWIQSGLHQNNKWQRHELKNRSLEVNVFLW